MALLEWSDRYWEPAYDIEKVYDEMDRILGTAEAALGLRSVPRGTFPMINVHESPEAMTLVCELPGLEREALEITLDESSATITGERPRYTPPKGARQYRAERAFGKCTRTVSLPARIDPDSARTISRKGLLVIEANKPQEMQPKQIRVSGE